ncbi:2-aminooxy adenylosuccinate synthetase [Ochrobactrum phage vB_OspP_OH]|uniref:N6-succino-2-amino-2'-deoxyadenylate synthase n=1 Tax=Ochrobactrum phage vB_OspP_OH TaxID=2712957 RepID=A0A6G6XYM0_9CAUD|nr:2-aminooxy adenylosuccinate synthetase [Ochrobactrum phage vB_OspP_OH]QIG66088.1 adenylosuccinate synthetase [Ochrobactrum phage vB_OspP_OH]
MARPLFKVGTVHVLVDGQFGSTGKGVLAAWLAEQADNGDVDFHWVVSNAGPNSGHTFYDNHGEKHVLKQLPTFAVAKYVNEHTNTPNVYLSAGAIIDPEILFAEARRYHGLRIYVHRNAAVITQEDKDSEHSGTVAAVAGTRSGTGAALARKVLRDPSVVFGQYAKGRDLPDNVYPVDGVVDWSQLNVFVEVSQGFSLGLNSAFYPKVTSRECTVMQALADARIPAQLLGRVYMSCRTFPIRVGNVDGYSSGEVYPDQTEISWEDLGQTPELTTVTKRVRRVFTFSNMQTIEAALANYPDFVFLNFMNYLTEEGQRDILEQIDLINKQLPKQFDLILSHGPTSDDVEQVG